jgi:hypothetical protein
MSFSPSAKKAGLDSTCSLEEEEDDQINEREWRRERDRRRRRLERERDRRTEEEEGTSGLRESTAETARRNDQRGGGGDKRTKQQRNKGVVETEAEKAAKRRVQKKRDIYKATKGWLYDDGKEMDAGGGDQAHRRGSETRVRVELTNRRHTRETYTAVALRGGCLSRMIAARSIPMTQ